jgi:hypothetical protein
MKTKKQTEKEENQFTRSRVEKVVGYVTEWAVWKDRIHFRIGSDVTLKVLTALSEELGTDAINFNFGSEGEPGYSSWTPGTDSTPGYIEVMFPIKPSVLED